MSKTLRSVTLESSLWLPFCPKTATDVIIIIIFKRIQKRRMQLPRSQYIPYATNTPFQENIKWGVYRFAVFSKSGQRGNKAVLLQHDGEI